MSKPLRHRLGYILLSVGCLLSVSCSKEADQKRALAKADTFFTAGAFDSAEVEYLNTLKADPLNPRALAQLGLIYAEQGRMGNAAYFLVNAREKQPDNLEVRMKLGMLYLAVKKPGEARAEANYILTHQPDHPEAPLLLAESIQQPKDLVESKNFLLKLHPEPKAPALTALATLALRQHQIAEAEALLKQAVALEPQSATVNNALGGLYLAQNNPKAAEVAFATAWENSPLRSPRKLSYVRFKLKTGNLVEARRLLEQITTKAPDILPPQLLLAEIAAQEKKYDEALAITGRILNRDQLNYPTLILNARLLVAKGETEKALVELETIRKNQPRNPEILFQLALIYIAQGESNKAISHLTQAVTLASNYTEAIMLLADLNLKKGDAKAASAIIKPLVAQRPDLIPAKFLLARSYVSQGALDEALQTFQEIAAVSPKDVNLLLPIALIYRQQKKPEEARKVLDQALAIAPDFVPAIEQLVDMDLMNGDFTAARQRADALKSKQPDKAGAYLLFAKIHLVQKNLPEAETELLKAIALQPDTYAAYYLLAGIYGQTDQDQKALDQLDLVARKNPANASLLMRIALLQDKLKKFPAARAAYEKVLVLKPEFIPALNNLAYLLADKFNAADRGLVLAQKARELAPGDPNVADTLGWILYNQGQYPRARALLFESAEKLSGEASAHFHLGMAQYMMGEAEPARLSLQRALKLNPALPEKNLINQRLAILGGTGEPTGGELRAILEKAIAENKNDAMALASLGALLATTGALEQAENHLKAALAINPHNIMANLALIRVHLARHETEPALALAKATRLENPNNPSVSYQVGRIAFQMGDHPWAASLLQESARQLPDDVEVLFDWAKAAYSMGRVSDTEETMRHILKIQPGFHGSAEISAYLDMIAWAAQPTSDATGKIEQALKTDPAFVPALMAQGAQAEKQSNFRAAAQTYAKALAQYPEFTPAKRSLALLAAATEDTIPESYNFALQAREAFPQDPNVAQALGILAYRKGDFSRSVNLLKECLGRLGEDARRLFFLGMAQHQLKDKAALANLQRSLALGLKGEAAAEAEKAIAGLK